MNRPLIIQNDFSMVLNTSVPEFSTINSSLVKFSEVVESSNVMYIYKITDISIWNACSLNVSLDFIKDTLSNVSTGDVSKLIEHITIWYNTYGAFEMCSITEEPVIRSQTTEFGFMFITFYNENAFQKIANNINIYPFIYKIMSTGLLVKNELYNKFMESLTKEGYGLTKTTNKDYLFVRIKFPVPQPVLDSLSRFIFRTYENPKGFVIKSIDRGEFKSECSKHGYPVKDLVPFTPGTKLDITMRKGTKRNGKKLEERDIQIEASNSIVDSGHGIVVMPCGSGKTIIGISTACKFKTTTLVITSKAASVTQWKNEFINCTDIDPEQVCSYSGEEKIIKPITIVTYKMLTYRKSRNASFDHLMKFLQYNWGFIIFDEIHTMPAELLRFVAALQSKKRLGLTATFIREDGREKDIFTLVGPKRYDKPWKDVEEKGYIASINLKEIRIDFNPEEQELYNSSTNVNDKFDLASNNSNKIKILMQLLEKHKNEKILVIGEHPGQLKKISEILKAPYVDGKTPNKIRDSVYEDMRQNKHRILVASKVANEAIDIPDISVIIQVSFFYGSRSEEAQRVGRGTRPKDIEAYFYTLVTKNSIEEKYNFNRQQFLTEQGYKYNIESMVI